MPRRRRRPNAEQHRRRFSAIRIFVGARKLRRSEARQADAQQANADGAFVHEHRIGCINDGTRIPPPHEAFVHAHRIRRLHHCASGATTPRWPRHPHSCLLSCIIARPARQLYRPLAELARPSVKPQFRGNSSMRILAGLKRAGRCNQPSKTLTTIRITPVGLRRAAQVRLAGKSRFMPCARPLRARHTSTWAFITLPATRPSATGRPRANRPQWRASCHTPARRPPNAASPAYCGLDVRCQPPQ